MIAANAVPYSLWNDFLQWTWLYQPVVGLASTLLWGVYVYFTIRTFREIRRQTDLQSEAFLTVAAQKLDGRGNLKRDMPVDATSLHEKWREILKKNLPGAIQAEKWLVLKFTNRGRADIIHWKITVVASVEPGGYLDKQYNIRGEQVMWQVAYAGHRDIVPLETGQSIEVPIAVIGAFPIVEFSWLVSYGDTRDKRYERFGGDSTFKDQNALALIAAPLPAAATPAFPRPPII